MNKKKPFKKMPPEVSEKQNIEDRKVVQGVSDFALLADAIMHSGDDRRDRERIFLEKLGQPDLFIPFLPEDGGDPSGESGIGYWRVKGGVISYRRWGTGIYDIHSREEYTDQEIRQLFALLERPPRNK